MRKCDSAATRELALSVTLLMEHAGYGIIAAMERRFGDLTGKKTLIFCGKGHNGGDGLVVARGLLAKGGDVTVIMCDRIADLKAVPKEQAGRFLRFVKLSGLGSTGRMLEKPPRKRLSMLPDHDFVLDAIFGTGFSGKAKGYHARAIEWMNKSSGAKIAVDVPSGLNADSGRAEGRVFLADWTLTFQAKKLGLLICEGSAYAGSVEVVDLGIPPAMVSRFAMTAGLADRADVLRTLPLRPRTAHKHSVGKVLVIAGSVGFAGAAALAAESALRSGAGSVVLCSPTSLYRILSKKLTEVMVVPLSETGEGALSGAALKELEPHLTWADVVALGPGLSRNIETRGLIRDIVERSPQRLILDADGINAFSGCPELLQGGSSHSLVITPHAGEFSRLTGHSSREIEQNRLELARAFARRRRLFVVLKGAPTVTAAPSGALVLNDTGNPGMATAGSGDVLTGILAGLWAQGMAPDDAAVAAVYLHGLAGDLAKSRFGERSLLALDLLSELPHAFAIVEGGGRSRVG